jgi:hypothetical protein
MTEGRGGVAAGSDNPPRPYCLAKWDEHTFCSRDPGHELPHIAYDPMNRDQVLWPTVIGGLFQHSPGGWYRRPAP